MPPHAASSKSVLLYHVYLKNNWRQVTRKLLANAPHPDFYININVDANALWKVPVAWLFFKSYRQCRYITVTLNNGNRSEVTGFVKLRQAIRNKGYKLLTYMHAKGVTRPQNIYIKDWVELMRYFIVDRMDLCLQAFSKGFKLYGVNLGVYDATEERFGPYRFSDFHFSGTFVTANLELLGPAFFTTLVDVDYFGVESFWGKLCEVQEVYCPHTSHTNHYKEPYAEAMYKMTAPAGLP